LIRLTSRQVQGLPIALAQSDHHLHLADNRMANTWVARVFVWGRVGLMSERSLHFEAASLD